MKWNHTGSCFTEEERNAVVIDFVTFCMERKCDFVLQVNPRAFSGGIGSSFCLGGGVTEEKGTLICLQKSQVCYLLEAFIIKLGYHLQQWNESAAEHVPKIIMPFRNYREVNTPSPPHPQFYPHV